MADNVPVTAGSGTNIATDDVSGVHFQKVKLDVGGDGASVPATGDGTYGLDVDVTRVSNVGQLPSALVGGRLDVNIGAVGATLAVTDGGGSLTVDASSLPLPTGAATEATLAGIKTGTDKIPASPSQEHVSAASPHSARLTDGSAFYEAAKTGQLPAALVSGRLDVHIGAASGTVPVSDAGGSITVDGTVTANCNDGGGSITVDDGGTTISVDDGGGILTVDGSVTAVQGNAGSVGQSWFTRVGDGTNTAGLTNVSGSQCLNVAVLQSATHGQQDKSGFTEGTTVMTPVGGVYNDTISSDPSEDQAAALRITAKRGLHVNLRNASGTEIGTTSNPVQVGDAGGSLTVDAPVGTPVFVRLSDGAAAITNLATNLAQVGGNAVSTAASGIPKVGLTDHAGANYGYLNPLLVQPAAPMFTLWRAHATYSASQTDIALVTPNGGKRLVITSIIVTVTGSGILAIYDGSNTSSTQLYKGSPPAGVFVINFAVPQKLSNINNVLRYSTGSGATGDICIQGYEVDS